MLLLLGSIREFCDLSVPIIMFDKDSNYVVMKLEEVSLKNPVVRSGDVSC